jgi:hypothetical protein
LVFWIKYNSQTSPCDHMIFVAKSSPMRTQILRRVTDRLTVRRLVNINPGWPSTSSTAARSRPQHHRLRSPRSESKSFSFLKQAHGVKRAIKEAWEGGGAAAPSCWARGGTTAPAQGGATAPSRGGATAPPSPEEVKRLKPPRCKVPPPLRAPKVKFEDACFSVKMLYQAWQSLGKVAVQLEVQRPTDPL